MPNKDDQLMNLQRVLKATPVARSQETSKEDKRTAMAIIKQLTGRTALPDRTRLFFMDFFFFNPKIKVSLFKLFGTNGTKYPVKGIFFKNQVDLYLKILWIQNHKHVQHH
jgi:hypothetical protein